MNTELIKVALVNIRQMNVHTMQPALKRTSVFALSICLASVAGIGDAEAYRGHHGQRHGGYGFGYRSHYLPAVVIGGGYGYPHHHRDVYRAHNAVPEPAPAEATSTKIFAYPNNGQTEQQQARDKFECYSWAVSESGFDPVAMATRGPSATPVTYTVRPNNPGPSDPLLGAAGGAALGAIGGAIAGDPGIGAAIGAAVGGTVGLANEVDESSRTKTVSTQSTTTTNPFASDDYRRAMSACLVARGYTVK